MVVVMVQVDYLPVRTLFQLYCSMAEVCTLQSGLYFMFLMFHTLSLTHTHTQLFYGSMDLSGVAGRLPMQRYSACHCWWKMFCWMDLWRSPCFFALMIFQRQTSVVVLAAIIAVPCHGGWVLQLQHGQRHRQNGGAVMPADALLIPADAHLMLEVRLCCKHDTLYITCWSAWSVWSVWLLDHVTYMLYIDAVLCYTSHK